MCPSTVQRLFAWLLVGAVIPGTAPVAWAAPQGERVVSGEASFSREGDLTQIRAGNNAIIDYQSFDILKNETVQFVQPSTSARVLNRIQSTDPTQIDGSLLANGRVYIVNPAGVFFGENALVDAAALFAAAGSMTNEDFLARRDRFTDLGGHVVNLGTIQADIVALLGQEVANRGQITAHGGMIALVAGDEVVLVPLGDRLRVRVASREGAPRPDGTAGVENSGSIDAGSGTVDLAAGDFYSLAIRQTAEGSIVARDVKIEGGYGGFVHVSGAIDASNPAPGESGGRIEVLGDYVALTGASLDASGDAGGGTVLVGGDFQGNGEARNARRTFVDAGSEIHADAGTNGDGGKVVVWANEAAGFHGHVSARGGRLGGDGGQVEVSGKALVMKGSVDTRAPSGETGSLLLDPTNINILNDTAGTPADDLEIADGQILTANRPGETLNISETALEGLGGTTNIILEATNNIIVQDLTDPGPTDGILNLATGATNSATFRADSDTAGGGTFTMNNTSNSITTQGGGLAISGTGLTVGNLQTNGGAIVLDAKSGTATIAGNVASTGAQIDVSANDLTLTGTLNSGTAPTTITDSDGSGIGLGATAGGLTVSGAELDAITAGGLTLETAGAITVNGITGAQSDTVNEVTLKAGTTIDFATASSTLDSLDAIANSGINLATNVTTSGDQTYNDAVTLVADTTLTSTGSGQITFNASVDGTAAGQQSLTVNTAGVTTFGDGEDTVDDDRVGANVALQSLTTDDDAGTANGPGPTNERTVLNIADTGVDVQTDGVGGAAGDGNQTYNDAVVLAQDTVLDADNGNPATDLGAISFNASVDGTAIGQQSLTVNTAGVTTFGDGEDALDDDRVGANVALQSLTTDDDAGTANGPGPTNERTVLNIADTGVDVQTDGVGGAAGDGNQTYNDAVVLAQDTVLDADNGNPATGLGAISFNASVDGTAAGQQSLTVNTAGVTTFGDGEDTVDDDRVGANVALQSLTTDDDAGTANGPGPTNERTVLNIADTGVDVQTDGVGGAAGDGNQTYNDAVVLAQDTVLDADNGNPATDLGAISFNASVDGTAIGQQSLTVNTAGVTTFGDGEDALDDDRVGANVALQSLTTDDDAGTANGPGPTNERTVLNIADTGVDVQTDGVGGAAGDGNQTYNDAVVLAQDTVLSASNGVPAATAATGRGAISFNASVDGTAIGQQSLTINTAGVTTFGDGEDTVDDDRVGANVALQSLTTDDDAGTANGPGPTNERTVLNIADTGVDVQTDGVGGAAGDGNQTYNDAVVLAQDTVLSASNGVPAATAATGRGAISFNASVDGTAIGQQSLTINTAGVTTFGDGEDAVDDDRVGANVALQSLTTDDDAGTANGPGPTNERTVLNIADTGVDVQTDGVGGAAGDGNQTYNDAVVLAQDTVLDADNGNPATGLGAISFNASVDGTAAGQQSLTVNTAGVTTFGDGEDTVDDDRVGANVALQSLTTDDDAGTANGPGPTNERTVLNIADTGVDVQTDGVGGAAGDGNQTYNDAVVLAQDTVLDADNGNPATGLGAISFNASVDGTAAGQQSLTVNTAGVTTFGDGEDTVDDDRVGANVALQSLTTDDDAGTANGPGPTNERTVLNIADTGVDVQTDGVGGAAGDGNQTYNDAVVLAQDTVLDADNGNPATGLGAISFNASVDGTAIGQQSLTVNTAGVTTFGDGEDTVDDDRVGANVALQSLTTDDDAGTANGPGPTNERTVLNIADTGVDVQTDGVGGAAGDGNQTYNDAVVLAQDTVLDADNGNPATGLGAISFNASVDGTAAGQQSLTVNTAGVTTFGDGEDTVDDDRVGANVALQSLTTDDDAGTANGPGPTNERTVLNIADTGVDVQTDGVGGAAGDGNQTYNDAVVLAQDTVLDADNGNPATDLGAISFNASVDGTAIGQQSLTVNTAGVTTFGDGEDALDDDRVGANVALQSLTTDDDAGTANGPGPTNERTVLNIADTGVDVQTDGVGGAAGDGNQTYNDAVVLAQDTVLDADNGNPATGRGAISFNASVDGTAAGQQSLTVNTAGVTTFGDGEDTVDDDRVGANVALQSLTTDDDAGTANGPGPTNERTVLNIADTGVDVQTDGVGGAAGDGNQTYNDAVVLAQDTVLDADNGNPATGLGAISFNASVDGTAIGQQSLTVNTAGVTTFGDGEDTVDDDRVGANVALQSLTTDDDAGTANGPGPTNERTVLNIADTGVDVQTDGVGGAAGDGNQTYNDAVVLAQDTVLDADNGDASTDVGGVTFGSTVDSEAGETNDLTVDTSGGGKVTFGGDVGGTAGAELGTLTVDVGTGPNGTIEFDTNANRVVAMDDIELNKGGRSAVPTNATIFKKSGDLAITSNTGKVTFGQRDKITVGGALNIEASAAGTGGVTVPDVNAVDLELNAGAGEITVLGREPAPSANSNGKGGKDRGADIVADSITLIGDLKLEAGGTGQTVVDVGSRSGGAAGEVSPAVLTAPFVLRTAFREGGPVTAADLVAGDQALDLTPGGAAPGSQRAPKNPIPFLLERPSGGVNAAAASERPLRESELSAFLACDPEDTPCQEEAVGAARASSDEALALQESFKELFGAPGPAAATAAGPDENPKREALQRAVEAYRTQTGSEPSGVAFRQFVESSPQQRAALETLDDLLALFQDARAFGMTGEGIGDFKNETLQEIAPEGISIEALDAAVEAGALNPSGPQAETPSESSSVAAHG